MRSAPTLLAAAEDKRFHEPSLLLPNMHPVLPNINSRMRHAARSSTRLSCRNRCEQCVRDARKAERRRDGRRRETTGAPESILSPLVTRSLTLSTHLYLQSVSGRSHCNKLPRRPTRWTTPPPVQPPILTNSDNLTPDSDLVSQNLRQQRPAAERGGGPVLLRPHSLNLSTYLPPISSPPLI